MPRIVHFEIPAEDPDSLAAFYQKVFDWKIEKWDGPMNYWLVRTGDEGPGIDGAIMGRNPTHQTPVNILDVPSVTDYSERVAAEGGEVIAPKAAIPGVGYVAYCHDTAGNVFGIFQGDDAAA